MKLTRIIVGALRLVLILAVSSLSLAACGTLGGSANGVPPGGGGCSSGQTCILSGSKCAITDKFTGNKSLNAWSYGGTCTIYFSQPPSGTLYLSFTSDIGVNGVANANASNPVVFTMGGSTTGNCLFDTNPTTLYVARSLSPGAPILADTSWTWNSSDHC